MLSCPSLIHQQPTYVSQGCKRKVADTHHNSKGSTSLCDDLVSLIGKIGNANGRGRLCGSCGSHVCSVVTRRGEVEFSGQ